MFSSFKKLLIAVGLVLVGLLARSSSPVTALECAALSFIETTAEHPPADDDTDPARQDRDDRDLEADDDFDELDTEADQRVAIGSLPACSQTASMRVFAAPPLRSRPPPSIEPPPPRA